MNESAPIMQASVVSTFCAKRNIGLDIIRAGAISLVLGSHFVKTMAFLGIYGVELFFALSGFLVGGILYRGLAKSDRWSLTEIRLFCLRRWWRTLPNYYLFLAVSVIFSYCYGGLPSANGAIPYFVFCQNLFSGDYTFYGVSWSLCVEQWFYLLFPLCILLFTILGLSKRFALVASTLLFLLFPALLRELMLAQHCDPAAIRMMTIPRLDAVFYGVVASFVVARHQLSHFVKVMLLIGACVGLITLSIFYNYCFQTNACWVWFYRIAFLAMPVCFSLSLPFFSSIKALPKRCNFLTLPITSLSLWSYSLYLSHIPILSFVYSAFGQSREQTTINALSKIVGLSLCVIVSSLIYRYFEARLMSLRPAERHPAKAYPEVESRIVGCY